MELKKRLPRMHERMASIADEGGWMPSLGLKRSNTNSRIEERIESLGAIPSCFLAFNS